MTIRKPIVHVQGPVTSDLVAVWGASLIGISIHDATAHDSDTCTLKFAVSAPFPALPPEGTRYTVSVGWSASTMAMTGIYTVQRCVIEGDPDGGSVLTVECRAADLADKAKTVDSGHWENTTLGAIVDDVAGRLGLTAMVDPELRAIAILYRARLDEEAAAFLTDLADDFGGAVKVAGGKVVVTKRGSGRSASGAALPTLIVRHGPEYRFGFGFEPRAADAESIGSWWDEETGTWRAESDTGSGKGRLAEPHPWPSKAEAKHGARAKRRQRQRVSATGSVEGPGDPAAVAGCPVRVEGYGPDADGTPWIAESIDHEIDPEGGWIMTTALETKDKGKES